MALEVVVVLVVAVGVITVAVVADARRHRQDTSSRTLVPYRTRQVMEAFGSGVIVVDRRTRRAAASNALAVGLGIVRPDGALLPEVADIAESAWEAGEPREADLTITRGVLGTNAEVFVRATPLDDALALVVANDHTDQHTAELTRREFAVNVSHELKTPVGALSLLAETIEAEAEDPDTVREFAQKIGKESRRLNKLIQEIIEISRIQGTATVIDRKEVALRDVIGEAVEAARTSAEARAISFVLPSGPKSSVLGDRDLLVMAVRNLVDNAVAYSHEGGGVTITIEEDGGVASIVVVDRGIGIAPGEQERIFERFYRTDPARSRASGGTGLGLSIVKHIAAQHDGEVTVWSKLGVGSTFTLRLPLYEKGAS
jgi:two-component system sensor histidine kinase SenX3